MPHFAAVALMVATALAVEIRPAAGQDDFAMRLRAWEGHLDVVEQVTPGTRYAYRRCLIRFFADTLVDPTDDTLTEDAISAYLRTVPRNGSTRSDMIRALKAYSRYAASRRGKDPTERLHVPPRRRRKKNLIPEDAVRAMLRAAFRRERRRGWTFLLMAETGARVGSVVAVEAEDVGRDEITFRRAKNDKPYSVPLNHAARIAAEHLIAEGRSPLVGVGEERIRQWMREAAEEADLVKVLWHPHQLRSYFLTRLARVTDPGTWRQIANHSDLSQYPTYVAEDDSLAREAVRNLGQGSPRGGGRSSEAHGGR